MLCPISGKTITTVAELTTCGHVFDLHSLFLQCNGDDLRCALCRAPFLRTSIYCSPTLQSLLINKCDVGTQTVDEGFDNSISTQTESFYAGSIAPEHGDEPDALSDISDDEPPVGSFRTVDLVESNYVNPQSVIFNTMDTNVKDIIVHYNSLFARKQHLFKYIYQSLCDDASLVALTLARSGYLVYDIFYLRKTSTLHMFMLYSSKYKSNMVEHHLSIYKRHT